MYIHVHVCPPSPLVDWNIYYGVIMCACSRLPHMRVCVHMQILFLSIRHILIHKCSGRHFILFRFIVLHMWSHDMLDAVQGYIRLRLHGEKSGNLICIYVYSYMYTFMCIWMFLHMHAYVIWRNMHNLGPIGWVLTSCLFETFVCSRAAAVVRML